MRVKKFSTSGNENCIAAIARAKKQLGLGAALLSMSSTALSQNTVETITDWLELSGNSEPVSIGSENTSHSAFSTVQESSTISPTQSPPHCNGQAVTVNMSFGELPTNGDDVILGTHDADVIAALAGNDTICGQGGNDTIRAGSGDDWIDGGEGDDTILGHAGNDMIFGGTGNDLIRGGLGDDYIDGEEGDDTIFGQGGNDMINGGSGVDSLSGDSGDDTIYTGTGATAGSAVFVSGGGGNDTIYGGPDADALRGSYGMDIIFGEGGNDIIDGGGGADTLYGGDGEDVFSDFSNTDTIYPEAGIGSLPPDSEHASHGNDPDNEQSEPANPAGAACDETAVPDNTDAGCQTIDTPSTVASESPRIVINEFVASNNTSLLDNTGDNPDWIELHNTSGTPVDLLGWTLTAGQDTHIFTGPVLDPGEFLVLFASGDPQRSVAGELHLDFKLSAAGESLILADDLGNISHPAWVATYPVQTPDVSYGLNTDGRETYFSAPTPGSTNSSGVDGFVQAVSFSPDHGFYETAQSVVLSSATQSATIRYTLDGSTPSIGNGVSVPSGTAITISQTTVLRAIAVRDGWASSAPETRSYIFASDIVARNESTPAGWPADNTINGMRTFYGMDNNLSAAERVAAEVSLTAIPSISITTDLHHLFDPTTGIWANPRSRGKQWERPATVELIDPTGTEPGFDINGGLRIKGGGSRNPNNFKHSMRLVFNNGYGDGELIYPLHGVEGVDTFESLDLKTAQSWSWNRSLAPRVGRGTDADWLRDVWNRDTQGAMGHPYTRSRYVHVFLNGHYWGLYYTEERTSNQYASQYLGGKEGDYDVIKQDPSQLSLTIKARDGTVDDWISMWSMVEDHQLSDEEWWRFQDEVNVVNLADFYLLMWVAGDSDSTPRYNLERSNNWLAIRNRTGTGIGGKWHFIDTDSESALCTNVQPERTPEWNPTPPWNLDASLGFGIPDQYHLTPAWLMEAALTRPEFVQIFQQRVQHHLLTPGGALTVDESIARLDNRLVSVDAAIDAEAARWGNTWVEPGFDRTHWELASQNVRNCFALRTSVMLDYLHEDGLVPAGAN